MKHLFRGQGMHTAGYVEGKSVVQLSNGDVYIIPSGAFVQIYEHTAEAIRKLTCEITQIKPDTLECETVEE